jgi:hypothetical protein
MVISQTTLGELYASLSPEEIKGLGLYLQKNTVGKNNTILVLHKFLCQAKQAKKLDQLDTDDIKSDLFGGDSKSVSKLTTYNNLLINHIKDYLLLSKIQEKNIYTETLWGEILIERRLKRNLLLKLTNFKFDLYKDSYALMKKFFHQREFFFYQYLTLTKKNYSHLIRSQIEQINSFLDYYIYYLLETGNSLITLSKQVNYNIEEQVSYFKQLANENLNTNNELVKIRALSLNLSLDYEKDSFHYLKSFFTDRINDFSDEIRNQLFPALINYGTNKINRGNEEFEIQNYQIFSIVDNAQILFNQGFFSVIRLYAYIRLELRFGAIEKAEHLLEESLKVIAPSQKDSFQYLIESRIAFAKNDYKLSLRKISIINPADSIYYYPQYKIMLIKCYIMLADIDRLNAEQENFYKYINAHKNIQDDEKRRHKLYIKYTEYLTESRYEYLTDYMKKRIENALLQTSPYFSEKQWVRERWEELKLLMLMPE